MSRFGGTLESPRKDITLCLAVDGNTIQQLAISWVTWKRHHPEMWAWPWLISYDPQTVSPAQLTLLGDMLHDHTGSFLFTEWPPLDLYPPPQYETQRERMVSSFVYAPAVHVTTEWFMKLDCDAICVRPDPNWLDPAWFEPLPEDSLHPGERNFYIANSWPYTKAKGGGGSIADWFIKLDAARQALGLPKGPDFFEYIQGNKVSYPRMASWFCFVNARWNRWLAEATGQFCGQCRLPVPSHDTWLWYVVLHGGFPHQTKRMLGKRRGWTNVPRLENLRQRVLGVMQE